ncbi:protein of unknown function DUF692 [Shewanella halifaxensis HAW-EB4]|uniref:Uncharacterized protein n=1 Tax=Shewanella halifaxensis (strain HAW-EB4) TaxID=458817 RepID=B0TNK6_SHEHH|nr:DUF692 domain-containing protein [Shewanella halifaxensis]ABZ78738.1 protein of unknown function DUF692 [Shewanella halifaxensis HAW-EB4]
MLSSSIAGAGIGLRIPHVQQLLADEAIKIPWLEVLVDNWLVDGGLNQYLLNAVSERFELVFHSVGLSLGGPSPLNFDYLRQIKALKEQCGAHWYSEHASFSGNDDFKVADLLPLPYTQEAVMHISQRIKQTQDFMGERILLENVSTYMSCRHNELNEGEFIAAIAEEADCYLLLDINNAFVTSINLDQSLQSFMEAIPVERVKQIHLAGFHDKGDYLLDAHNHPVDPSVWAGFKAYIQQHGAIPSMIEWDSDLPSLERLLQERDIAAGILQAASTGSVGDKAVSDTSIGDEQCA